MQLSSGLFTSTEIATWQQCPNAPIGCPAELDKCQGAIDMQLCSGLFPEMAFDNAPMGCPAIVLMQQNLC